MRGRLKTKGRSEHGSFAPVPHVILESQEYAGLTAYEVKLLLDIFGQYRGRNNGTLSAAWTVMQKRGWRSPDTLNRALRGLLAKGFIMKTRQGGLHRRCSFYAVTWKSIDDCGRNLDVQPTTVASNTWRQNTSSLSAIKTLKEVQRAA